MRAPALAATLLLPVLASAAEPPVQAYTVAVRLDTAETGEAHVAVTCDGTTATVYVDGEPQRTWTPDPERADPASVLWSVAAPESGEVEVVGLSLYERKLTEEEITQLPACPPAQQAGMQVCDQVDLCACEPAPTAPSPTPSER